MELQSIVPQGKVPGDFVGNLGHKFKSVGHVLSFSVIQTGSDFNLKSCDGDKV